MTTANWRRVGVLLALALSAFLFNTTENLPIGVLHLISADLGVSLSSTGYLVTSYGLIVAVVSLPVAHVTRRMPRRYLLTAILVLLVLASWVAVVASSYSVLLAARMATALAQALFWAVTAPVAVGLFSTQVRGRVVAVMSVGGSLATILGVPAGTWLGHRGGWQLPFLVISVLSLVPLVVIALLLPTSPPEESHGAYGSAPDARRLAVVLATTALSVTGMFTAFTYVVDLLTRHSGFSERSIGLLLFVFGLAGTAGVVGLGPFLDRLPRASLVGTVAGQAVALFGLYAYASHRVAVVLLLALLGLCAAPVFMATQARILHVAPGRTEIGFAANSAAFNVGIAVGALTGGLVLSAFDARSAFVVGALVTVAALVALAAEPLLSRRQAAAAAPDDVSGRVSASAVD